MAILEAIADFFSREKDPFPRNSSYDIEYKLKGCLRDFREERGDKDKLQKHIESYLSSLSCKDKRLFKKYNKVYSEYRDR